MFTHQFSSPKSAQGRGSRNTVWPWANVLIVRSGILKHPLFGGTFEHGRNTSTRSPKGLFLIVAAQPTKVPKAHSDKNVQGALAVWYPHEGKRLFFLNPRI